MPGSIVFVGTSHLDPWGRRRLSSLLSFLQPDVVAVEIDADRARRIDGWGDHYGVIMQRFHAKYPGSDATTLDWFVKNYAYEYREGKEHCAKNDARIAYIDDALEDNPANKRVDIGRLLAMPLGMILAIGNEQYRKRKSFREEMIPWLQARDDIMESRIREISGRVLFVGGAGHVFGDYGNLYDRFADSDVARYPLNIAGSPNWMKRVERALPIKW